MANHQLRLLRQQRFLPYLLTLFLGAFNDNIFKNGLLAVLTYGLLQHSYNLNLLNNLAALLFIAPFFLFSAIAGQLADKYPPARLIRHIKFLEIIIMGFAVVALWVQSIPLLLLLLFLMGSQSAFFGPIKYGIIPRQVGSEELVGANGLVEMATFIAILLGTLVASALILQTQPIFLISLSILAMAVLGWLTSLAIPALAPATNDLKLDFNVLRSTKNTLALCFNQPQLRICNVGISWFWFLGASYLTQIYLYAKDYLQGDQTVVMALLCCFSIGIGVGSLICARLSRIVPATWITLIGATAISIMTLVLVGLTPNEFQPNNDSLISLAVWLPQGLSIAILSSFFAIGLAGGLYIVPLYARIQLLSSTEQRAQIIAAVNIVNALAMILSAVVSIIVLVWLAQPLPHLFLLLAVLNVVILMIMIRADKGLIKHARPKPG